MIPVALLSKLIAPPLVVVAQVAQAMVPVVVKVPPVIGLVVATLVTVPDPPPGDPQVQVEIFEDGLLQPRY